MLSRLALKTGQRSSFLSVLAKQESNAIRCSTTVATKNEERDEVNFPTLKPPVNPGKVRNGFIPEELFQFFHSKTGVTGPYVFGIGVMTFLCSKEYFILEHEFFCGSMLAIMTYGLVKKLGPSISEQLSAEVDEVIEDMKEESESRRRELEGEIEYGNYQIGEIKKLPLFIDVYKHKCELQREAEYRRRLFEMHKAVKQKLDYQLEISNVKTRIEQKHMVDWIITNVRKSITPSHEAAALKQCFSDLKGIAARA